MSIDLGNTPVGTPPTPTEQTQLRTSFGLGAADTVEFGGFVPPSGTTAEIDLVADAVVGQVMINSDSGQLVRFTGPATYEVITSSSYVPVIDTTPDAALTLSATRLFESGVFAGSPDPFSPTDHLITYTNKDPLNPTGPVDYIYYDGSLGGIAEWYNVLNIGTSVTAPVFTADTLMRLTLSSDKVPFVFNTYIINTETPDELASVTLKAGSTYEFKFKINFLDLLGSNFEIAVEYSGLFGDGGSLSFINKDTRNKNTLYDFSINNPSESTSLLMSAGGFTGVSGSNFGSWTVSGILKPSSDGTLTINGSQSSASVEPLFLSAPSMTVTLLT